MKSKNLHNQLICLLHDHQAAFAEEEEGDSADDRRNLNLSITARIKGSVSHVQTRIVWVKLRTFTWETGEWFTCEAKNISTQTEIFFYFSTILKYPALVSINRNKNSPCCGLETKPQPQLLFLRGSRFWSSITRSNIYRMKGLSLYENNTETNHCSHPLKTIYF